MPVSADTTDNVVHKSAFSTNGDRMLNGFTESTDTGGRIVGVRVRNVEHRKKYPSVSEPNQADSVALALAPDDNMAATGDGTGKVLCVAFSKDGKRLATGSWDTTAKIWDLEKCLGGK